MSSELNHIVRQFKFEGEFLNVEPYGYGHIHDTYVVHFKKSSGARKRYILQRVNHTVFNDPAGLTQNILAVTAHLRGKIIQDGGDPNRETLTLIPTVDQNYLFQSNLGEFWRAYLFIDGAQTCQSPNDLEQVYHVGKAYGEFQKMLADFPASQLHETIPDFHHTPKRLMQLREAVHRDPFGRAGKAREDIAFALEREEFTSILTDKFFQGELPRRVIHNDTKFNNVMMDDQTGEGVCVIDLDTVMPGLSVYDFGDAIRSIANKSAEDQGNLSKVGIDLDIYEKFSHGFLDATRDFLTSAEIDLLPLSARMMTLENGIRFLTDHLDGDLYFKIHREGQNLDRCRNQFKLVLEMEGRYEEMIEIVERYQ